MNEYNNEVVILTREDLLKELQEVYETIDTKKAIEFQRKWRRIESWESAYEEELNEKFEALINHSFSKQKENNASNKVAKEDIINEAKTLLNTSNLNEATKKMNDLMNTWKATGSAGRQEDDLLWNEFSEVKNAFYDLKQKHWNDLQVKFAKAKEVKEEIIKTAETLKTDENYKETSDKFNELLNEWKKVGTAGKKFENNLWEMFNTHRQEFYAKRESYYQEVRENNLECANKKEELIKEVKEVCATANLSKETTEKMKEFNLRWKAIGFAGKNKEDALWEEFRSTIDGYFNALKTFNDNKRQNWLEMMNDRKSQKAQTIEQQRRLIERLTNDKVGTISERAIREIDEEIEDVKEYIIELEAELSEINKSLEN